jgi:type I restriction enzyme R subunit
MLIGEEFEEDLEEPTWFDLAPGVDEKPRILEYNPDIPIETIDFIITDECHRSIYNLWRQVLEYFDACLIGLTATPSKYTLGLFDQNFVTDYSHELSSGWRQRQLRSSISKLSPMLGVQQKTAGNLTCG